MMAKFKHDSHRVNQFGKVEEQNVKLRVRRFSLDQWSI